LRDVARICAKTLPRIDAISRARNPGKVPQFLSVVLVASVVLAAVAQTSPQSTLIDAPQLLADARTLAADDMQGRQTGTTGGAKARAFIVERFRAVGLDPIGASYEHPFDFTQAGRTFRGANVIGKIAGQARAGRYLVLSAHFDHLGVRDGTVFNGADDNASGVAALVALGAYFKAHPPAHSLIVAAFDAEELGMRGSQAFVARPPVEVSALALNLNFDMIGREPANRLFVAGTARRPFLKPAIEAVALNVPVRLLAGHEEWTSDSDQISFLNAGIPALYFGVEDFAQHHQPTDDFDTLTHEFYVRAVETLVRVVERFDRDLEGLDATRNH
jgi:hypothetical protein